MKASMPLYIVLVTLGLSLAGCGASKTPVGDESDLSSRIDPEDESDGTSSAGLLAECNQFHDSSLGLKGQMSTYYENYQFVADYIRLRFENLPSDIVDTDGSYIQFFRWLEDSPGQAYTNNEPVKMYVIKRGSAEFINEEPITSLSRNTIKAMIAEGNMTGVTPATFFKHAILVLTGMDLRYDALMIASYNSSTDLAKGWVGALLPAFSADPNAYEDMHSGKSLVELHPFYDRRNSGLSESQFQLMSDEYCEEFFL